MNGMIIYMVKRHETAKISYHAGTFSVAQVRICWEGVYLRSSVSWRGGMEGREYNALNRQ